MAKTRCIIVDDEPLAIEILDAYIDRLDDFEIAARCDDAIEAMNFLRTNTVDLMFLDIQMPRLSGIEFLKTLRNPPRVIFTTAYREYALEGYELNVIDYLLKPISFERFMSAINKFYEITEAPNTDFSLVAGDDSNEANSYILVKGNRKMHKINLSDIMLIESIKDYVQITATNRTITVKQQISTLEGSLPENKFVRIHRSFIVALRFIESFTATTIEIGDRELPIGRNYKNAAFRALKYNEG